MYGDHIANLTVYSKTSGQMAVLWQKSGTQGPNWKHGVVDVSSATKFQVSLNNLTFHCFWTFSLYIQCIRVLSVAQSKVRSS